MQAHLAKPVTLAALGTVLRRHCGFEPATAMPAGPSASVRARYEQRKVQTLRAVEALSRGADILDDEVSEAAGLLHKLAGTAAMFGEPAVGDLARALEDGLDRWSTVERAARVPTAAAALLDAARGTRRLAAG